MTSAGTLERLRLAFRELEAVLVELVEGDAWVDQTSSPLGRRAHNEACRTGKIAARKLRGKWMAKRSDVDAFIQKTGRKPVGDAEAREEANDLREIGNFRARRRSA